MNKVIFIYHYIAHYRLPIFQELKKSKVLDVDLGAGFFTDTPIKVITPDVLEFNLLQNKWLFNKNFLWQRGVVKLIFKKYNHFVFLGNPYFISTWVSLILCKILGQKASIWTHGVTNNLKGLKKIIFKILWRLSHEIFVYGNYAKNKMIEYGVDNKKITVVYNSLDYKKQLQIRENFKEKTNVFSNYFRNNDPVLIFTGRLTKVKKLDQIIKAMKLLCDQSLDCNLLFIGDGEEKNRLEEMVDELQLKNRVWFYGACYDEELIGDFFMNSLVCVAPGNVGLTAMHSLVFGIPVITHSDFENQMPEFESITENVTGSFFVKDDIEDLANKIKYWITLEESKYKGYKTLCYRVIDEKYNPVNQREIFENALMI